MFPFSECLVAFWVRREPSVLSCAALECGEVEDLRWGVRSVLFFCTRVTLRKTLINPVFCLSSPICKAGMKLWLELRKFLDLSYFEEHFAVISFSF